MCTRECLYQNQWNFLNVFVCTRVERAWGNMTLTFKSQIQSFQHLIQRDMCQTWKEFPGCEVTVTMTFDYWPLKSNWFLVSTLTFALNLKWFPPGTQSREQVSRQTDSFACIYLTQSYLRLMDFKMMDHKRKEKRNGYYKMFSSDTATLCILLSFVLPTITT